MVVREKCLKQRGEEKRKRVVEEERNKIKNMQESALWFISKKQTKECLINNYEMGKKRKTKKRKTKK